MTKVEIQFDVDRPLASEELERIADSHAIYGMLRLAPGPGEGKLTVEYDASRLTAADVEAALRRAGVPAH
jgi:hypothetical protein